MQFKSGDTVVYTNFGLCRIKKITFISFSPDRPKESYLVLYPVSNPNSTFYLPEKNALSELRHPLSKEEILALLEAAKNEELVWTDKRKTRSDEFRTILSNGVSPQLISLLHCLYCRREELKQHNKRLSSTDETFFASAEKLVQEEFAYSLKISKDEVNSFINVFFNSKS